MQLPDWLRRLFHRNGQKRSSKEALQELDAVITRNEMSLGNLREEIEKTDAALAGEEAKIRDKQVDGWRKRFVLQAVRRLRSHLTNLDRRMAIYDKHLTMALAMVGKVEDMEAMSLRGVSAEDVDRVLIDFEEQMQEYLNDVGVSIEPSDKVDEDRELEELEKEILGEKEEPTEIPIEPVVVEIPVEPEPPEPTVVVTAERRPERRPMSSQELVASGGFAEEEEEEEELLYE
jgi:hypothetical protein